MMYVATVILLAAAYAGTKVRIKTMPVLRSPYFTILKRQSPVQKTICQQVAYQWNTKEGIPVFTDSSKVIDEVMVDTSTISVPWGYSFEIPYKVGASQGNCSYSSGPALTVWGIYDAQSQPIKQ